MKVWKKKKKKKKPLTPFGHEIIPSTYAVVATELLGLWKTVSRLMRQYVRSKERSRGMLLCPCIAQACDTKSIYALHLPQFSVA